jgi:hypothetical protein
MMLHGGESLQEKIRQSLMPPMKVGEHLLEECVDFGVAQLHYPRDDFHHPLRITGLERSKQYAPIIRRERRFCPSHENRKSEIQLLGRAHRVAAQGLVNRDQACSCARLIQYDLFLQA